MRLTLTHFFHTLISIILTNTSTYYTKTTMMGGELNNFETSLIAIIHSAIMCLTNTS